MNDDLKAQAQKTHVYELCRDCRGTGYTEGLAPTEREGVKREVCGCGGPRRSFWYPRDGSLGAWTDAEMEAMICARR